MHRKELEVKDFNDIVDIISRCDVCRIALYDGEYPYVLPLNFGFEIIGEKIYIYFHCALKGKKLDLIKTDNKVGFEMDCSYKLVTINDKGFCTMEFESVIGRGDIIFIEEPEEKLRALKLLMKQYHDDGDFIIDKKTIPHTAVLKLSVKNITAKRKKNIKI